jgi:hypothetical protein
MEKNNKVKVKVKVKVKKPQKIKEGDRSKKHAKINVLKPNRTYIR